MKITIDQVAILLAFIVSLISSIEFLISRLKKQVDNTLGPINYSIKELDIAQCKNFLVSFLGNIEKGESFDEIEKQRAYEIYDHYTHDLKQNSYIHNRWEELIGGHYEK